MKSLLLFPLLFLTFLSLLLIGCENKRVFAAGDSCSGQFGIGLSKFKFTPTPVNASLFPSVSGFAFSSCAVDGLNRAVTCALLTDSGEFWCWGRSLNGLCGVNFTYGFYLYPPVRTITPFRFKSFSIGFDSHVLAISQNSSLLLSWGSNSNNQLGLVLNFNDTENVRPIPQVIDFSTTPLFNSSFSQVAAGSGTSFLLTSDGKIWVWGNNQNAQLGLGYSNASSFAQPQQLCVSCFSPLDSFISSLFITSSLNVFVITQNGALFAWSFDPSSSRGADSLCLNNTATPHIPQQILNGSQFKFVSGSLSHTLLLGQNGSVWSCGANNYGQVSLRFCGICSNYSHQFLL